jgi:hypothetical protein
VFIEDDIRPLLVNPLYIIHGLNEISRLLSVTVDEYLFVHKKNYHLINIHGLFVSSFRCSNIASDWQNRMQDWFTVKFSEVVQKQNGSLTITKVQFKI